MAKDYSKFTHEELIKYIEELQTQLKSEKYGLYWDKSIEKEKECINLFNNIPFFVRSDASLIEQNVDNNILIEGDNLRSLSILSMASHGQGIIDIIR